jgi:hypothetical protein
VAFDRDVHGARGLCADCQLQLGRDQDVIDMLTSREDACVVDPADPYLRAGDRVRGMRSHHNLPPTDQAIRFVRTLQVHKW